MNRIGTRHWCRSVLQLQSKLMFLISSFALLAVCRLSTSSGPIVDTPLGKVRGWERLSRDGRIYQAWTGIPYAQPPLGDLRLKPPKPAQKWKGILNATSDMPLCLQRSFKNPAIPSGTEDCLYLSVYRPRFTAMKKMPVLFHVHGGAFIGGSIGPRENADYLMDEDIVLVNIHYRLGVFGFTSLGDKVVPGNFGLKDQVMALKWVKKNIAAFGGDPNSVTVFGESAGGTCSQILLNSPATEDLVHRAQSDSGSIFNEGRAQTFYNVPDASRELAKNVGCTGSTSEEILNCLQKVNASIMLNATGPMSPELAFVPWFEPQDAENAVMTEDLSLRPSKKPWITSDTNGEYTVVQGLASHEYFIPAMRNLSAFLKQYVTKCIGNSNPTWVSLGARILEKIYFTEKATLENVTYDASKMMADVIFIYPALFNLNNHQGPKWYYYLEYIGELSKINPITGQSINATVAGHAETNRYQFNFRSDYPGVSPKQTPDDYKVSKRLIKYLVNFAYYDNPTPPGSPMQWDQFTDHEILRVTNSQADFQGSRSFFGQFQDVINVWSYVMGWP